jgi:hypothetical protein
MILNARTGVLSVEDEIVDDSQVLQLIGDHFSLQAGTEQAFTLQTFRRLFQVYPSLMPLNGWTEVFLEQAQHVKPKFHVVKDGGTAEVAGSHPVFDYLELSKQVTVQISELTKTAQEVEMIEAPEGVTILSERSSTRVFSIKIKYEDKPCYDVETDVELFGMDGGELHGLEMERLHRLMHLPIRMPGATHLYIQEFANESRTRVDVEKIIETKDVHAHPEITLLEAINAVLYSINLDEEDVYLAERQAWDEIMKDSDLGSLPVLPIFGDEHFDGDDQ